MSSGCSDGFIHHEYYCYGFMNQTLSWTDAQSACNSMGAYLAEPINLEQQIVLEGLMYHHLDNSTAFVWLGATDLHTENTWLWATSGKIR